MSELAEELRQAQLPQEPESVKAPPTRLSVMNGERRSGTRDAGQVFQYPIAFQLVTGQSGEAIPLEVMNYHFRGACFKVPESARSLLPKIQNSASDYYINAFLGKRQIREKIQFRVCWSTAEENGLIGVEFIQPVKEFQARKRRFRTNKNFPANLISPDPVDPNREVYFQVIDISESGLKLSSSMTNRHLIPGMVLEKATLTTPGQSAPGSVTVRIENIQDSNHEDTFCVGVSIQERSEAYDNLIKAYLSVFGTADAIQERTDELAGAGFLGKKLRSALSYRLVATEKEYEQVLKLRFDAFKKAGKLPFGTSWKDQGEGLQNEGEIIAAFLSGQMVATLEFRFGKRPEQLRSWKYFNLKEAQDQIDFSRAVEINKLVAHPSVQGSDIIVGMLQKVHAILASKGGFDIVVSATQNLLPLYKRIGFKTTGLTSRHQANPSMTLHLIYLKSEAYMKVEGMNPYVWTLIFEATQRRLEELGLADSVNWGWRKRVVRGVSGLVAKQKEKQKLKKKPAPRTQIIEKPLNDELEIAGIFDGGGDLDPKWTVPHMLSGVLYPYIIESDRLIGAHRTSAILRELRMPRSYFTRQGNWVSVAFLDAFLDQYSKYEDIAELSRRTGARSVAPEVLGMKYFLLKHFLKLETALKATESIVPRINRGRTYKIETFGPGRGRVSIGLTPGEPLPKHRESCLNWQESIAAYIRLMTRGHGSVVKTACCYDGAEACVYELHWNARLKKLQRVMIGVGLAGAVGLLFLVLQQANLRLGSNALALVLSIQTLGLGALWYRARSLKEQASDYRRNFDEFELASNERYSQLQDTRDELKKRYDELLLLDETSSAVLRNNEVSEIFRVTLDSICKKFGFSRAFIMLLDEKKQCLRAASVSGITDKLDELWRFQVSVAQKRENPMVLSSVFHSGTPIAINDVQNHLQILNPTSQKLLKALRVTSFTIVPIVSDEGKWGVLIADRGADQGQISDSDVMLLSRVAHHLGTALDKQAKLEKERQKTALFQKFVPAYARSKLLEQSNITLGWEVRDTVAMFIDMRSYTQRTSVLPPHAVATMVNGFYGLVQKTADEFHGYVDKFIGDAALVTWGYIKEEEGGEASAVRCALKLFEQLKNVNERLASEGIPPIELGVGIHRGPAVCGLFGCDERMEFTGIGSTVNAASRLQSLCKEYGAKLIVSEQIFDRLERDIRGQSWLERKNVQLRGISEPMRLAYLKAEEAA